MGDNDQTLGNETEEKVFTQSEVDKLMKKRWKKEKIEEAKPTVEEKDLEELAYEAGLDPKVFKEIQELKKFKETVEAERKAKQDKDEHSVKVDGELKKQRDEFSEKYPDIDLEKLENDKDFVEFVETANDKLSLVQIFDKYNGFTGKIQKEAVEKIQSKFKRSTASGKEGAGGSYNLTANQLGVAKSAGMTPKEYAEFLKDVQ